LRIVKKSSFETNRKPEILGNTTFKHQKKTDPIHQGQKLRSKHYALALSDFIADSAPHEGWTSGGMGYRKDPHDVQAMGAIPKDAHRHKLSQHDLIQHIPGCNGDHTDRAQGNAGPTRDKLQARESMGAQRRGGKRLSRRTDASSSGWEIRPWQTKPARM